MTDQTRINGAYVPKKGVRLPPTVLVADLDLGDKDAPTAWIGLDGSAANVQITNWTPTAGKTYHFTCFDSTNVTTLTASSGVTLDGTNDVVTFTAANQHLVLFAISATTCKVMANPDSLIFS